MKKSKKNIISLSILMLSLVSCATSITSSSNANNSKESSVNSAVSTEEATTTSIDSSLNDVNPSNETSNQSSSSKDDTNLSTDTPISSSNDTQMPSSNSFASSASSETSSKDIYYSSEMVSSSSSEELNSSENTSSSLTQDSSSEMSSSEEIIPEPEISYIGTYKGVLNEGDVNYKINNSNIVTIVITDTNVKMNGLETTIIEYDNYYGYTLSLNEKVFTLAYGDCDEEKALTITLTDEDNDYYIDPAYRIDQAVTIPSTYVGTFYGDLNDGDSEIKLNGTNRLTVRITTNSITINNIKADLLSFDEDNGFELLLNGFKYYLINDTYYDGVNVLTFSDDYNNYYCDLVIRSGYVIEE